MRSKKQPQKEGKPANGLLSQSKYAKQRGCSQPYISKMVRKGVITAVDGKIDPKLADQQLAAAAHPGHAKSNGSGEKPKNYYNALTDHTELKAKLAELDYEERCGRLIGIEAGEKEFARVGKAIKDSMLTIPKRLDGILAADIVRHLVELGITEQIASRVMDRYKMNAILTDEIHRSLKAFNEFSLTRGSRHKARPA